MIHKTYNVIGSLSREQRMLARANAPEVQQALTRETLKEKANTPNALEELKTLITTGSTARAERVKRAQEAAEMAGSATAAEMADTEKKAVIEASRQIIQEAMEQVATELRGATVEATRTALQKEQGELEGSRNKILEIEYKLSTLSEKLAIGGREVTSDLRGGDWKTWLKYGGAAIAGGAAAKWVWDHTIGWLWDKTIGDKEKPGFMRKFAGFLATMGGVALGAIGLNAMKRGALPEPIKYAGNAGKGAIDTVKEVGTPAVSTLIEAFKTIGCPVIELASGNPEKALDEFLKHGGGIFVEAGKTILVYGGKHVEVASTVMENINAWREGREVKKDDLAVAYGITGVLYALNRAILRTILMGKPGLLTHGFSLKSGLLLTGRTFAWPVSVVSDGVKTLHVLRTDGREIFAHKLGGFPLIGKRVREIKSALRAAKSGNAEGVTLAMEKYVALAEVRDYMRSHPDQIHKLGFTPAEVNKLENQLEKLGGTIQAELAGVEIPVTAPQYLRNLAERAKNKRGTVAEFCKKIEETFEAKPDAQAEVALTPIILPDQSEAKGKGGDVEPESGVVPGEKPKVGPGDTAAAKETTPQPAGMESAPPLPAVPKEINEGITKTEQELQAVKANTTLDANTRTSKTGTLTRRMKVYLRRLQALPGDPAIEQEIQRANKILAESGEGGAANPETALRAQSADLGAVAKTEADLKIDAQTGKTDTEARGGAEAKTDTDVSGVRGRK